MSNQTTLSRLRSFGGDRPTEADLRSQPRSGALLPGTVSITIKAVAGLLADSGRLDHLSKFDRLGKCGGDVDSVRRFANKFASQHRDEHRVHALGCGVGVRKETFRNRHVDKFLLRHLTCIIELLHKKLCECKQRGGRSHGRRVAQESLLKFHEFVDHCEARLQISYPRIPFPLELLNGLVKVSNGSPDLVIDKSCTLLQITSDVAHKPFPVLVHFKEAAPVIGGYACARGRGLTLVLILFPLGLEY